MAIYTLLLVLLVANALEKIVLTFFNRKNSITLSLIFDPHQLLLALIIADLWHYNSTKLIRNSRLFFTFIFSVND